MKVQTLVSLLALLPLTLAAQSLQDPAAVLLKNWSVPRQVPRPPAQMEQRVLTPKLQLPGGATPNVLIFVPMTPCRLADTRTTSTPSYPALGLTPLATLTPRTLPVAGSCELERVGFLFPGPEAYSLNVTVVPPAGTHGGYLLVYPNPATPVPLVASMTWNPNASYQTGAVVAAASSDGSVNIVANSATDVVVDINGYYAAPTGPQGDTALGIGALAGNTAGADNTAFGYLVLANNASGAFNAAFGALALGSNTSGLDNTAVGYAALSASTGGTDNTAVGYQAMKGMNGNVPPSGSQNTALGSLALQANVSGVGNTALGAGALQYGTGIYNTVIGLQAGASLTTGSHNILVGEEAGINVFAGNDNIQIGNGVGLVGDDSTIRIGGQDVQTSTYIAGIAGNILSSGSPVVVNVLGQLGVEGVSSRRLAVLLAHPAEKRTPSLPFTSNTVGRWSRHRDTNVGSSGRHQPPPKRLSTPAACCRPSTLRTLLRSGL